MLLLRNWGTPRHRALGYAYFGSMLMLLGTAFCVYRLSHTFGIFHYAAVLTLLTLLAGMVPVIGKKPAGWLRWHYTGLYWSVMELYVGLVAEVITHQSRLSFLPIAVWSAAVVFVPGGVVFWYWNQQWDARINPTE